MTYNKRLNITPTWYRNRSVRPKQFNLTVERQPNGSYRVVSGTVRAVVNQYETRTQPVDARDITRDIRRAVRGRKFAVL